MQLDSHVQDRKVALRGNVCCKNCRPVEAKLTYDSTCVMLYTSGTTGKPKGVVLSNRNIIETSRASCEFDDLRTG